MKKHFIFTLFLGLFLNGALFAASFSSSSSSAKRADPSGGRESEEEVTKKAWPAEIDAAYPNFDHWIRMCNFLNKDHSASIEDKELDSYVDKEMLQDQLILFLKQQHNHLINAPWFGKEPGPYYSDYAHAFKPFAQKLILPDNARISFHGDLHGDIHALNNYLVYLNQQNFLDGFKIIDDTFYMIFLGDYVDRGIYGLEVWYAILRLKNENPDRVIMLRGNHEDSAMNQLDTPGISFKEEVDVKMPEFDPDLLFQAYNFLPVVLYLGCENTTTNHTNYLQCCHGGLEPGYNPRDFLTSAKENNYCLVLGEDNKLDRTPELSKLSDECKESIYTAVPSESIACFLDMPVTCATSLGHMWFDFIVDSDTLFKFKPGRGWAFGNEITQEVLALHSSEQHSVRGVFRAHQHGDLEMMRRIYGYDGVESLDDIGIARLWPENTGETAPDALWDGIVCTFAVAPAMYGKSARVPFDYDAFGILSLHQEFEQWRLQTIRINESGSIVMFNPREEQE